MITGTVIGADRLVERLESITPSIRASLERTVKSLGLQLENRVKTQKLQGQVPDSEWPGHTSRAGGDP